MTLNLTTIACNVVLGYKQPFDLISVHDANDAYKLVGVAHLCTGLTLDFFVALSFELVDYRLFFHI